MTMGMHDPLTVSDLVNASEVIRACQRNAHVRYEDPEIGELLEGTMRSVGDERGNFLGPNDDVRDGYVRITTVNGFEHFMRFQTAVELVSKFLMAFD